MPSTWLSFEVLAIENKVELSENACLIRIDQPISKFLQTYLGNAMLISSVETKPAGKLSTTTKTTSSRSRY